MSQTSGHAATNPAHENTGETSRIQDTTSWITCQLGFRDHYLVPRVLHRAGVLRQAYTEIWVKPGSLIHRLGGQRLRERYHPELADAPVHAWNVRALGKELEYRARRLTLWPHILERNRWFQQRCIRALHSLRVRDAERVTLFAYSYAARDLLAYARSRGWRTVLGQMDAGQYDEQLMIELYARRAKVSGGWDRIPPEHWDNWRQECDLADRIVVNSSWSGEALTRAGIDGAKVRVVPLAYESHGPPQVTERDYPTAFTAQRPLRVLFLGMVNVRKGAAEAIEALGLLRDAPVHLTLVGPVGMNVNALPASSDPRLTIAGYLPRSIALQQYQSADVFLFPSHSDGFGMTQLEAQAHGLPIIASRHCGDVVRHERDGLLLPEVSASAIADALRRCLNDPEILRRFAREASRQQRFSVEEFGRSLLTLD